MGSPRIALLGAFAFPAPQGSQVFAWGQALALARAGARVRVLCYGHGQGPTPPGVEVDRVRASLTWPTYRSGPHALKPLTDLALVRLTARVVREHDVQLILAHNAEAALVALASRAAPVVYVAHTLLEQELSAYGPSAFAGGLDRAGRRIDRAVASRVDATIALSAFAAQRLAPYARGPVEIVPPGVECEPAPGEAEVARQCARFGLEPGGFALYAGNLDGYQEIATLRGIAGRLTDRTLVVATHGRASTADLAPLRVVQVAPEEVRTLTHGAAVAVATRRRCGGFPIKLLNYMEAGRAIVAREGQAQSLVDGCNARLLPRDADATGFARAIESLLRDPDHSRKLGRAARATAERGHDWNAIAGRTLGFLSGLGG
jgi:glycosyltransferase involved in cell wall biosynthesis